MIIVIFLLDNYLYIELRVYFIIISFGLIFGSVEGWRWREGEGEGEGEGNALMGLLGGFMGCWGDFRVFMWFVLGWLRILFGLLVSLEGILFGIIVFCLYLSILLFIFIISYELILKFDYL